jgi:sensor domain CHASE-containing protein
VTESGRESLSNTVHMHFRYSPRMREQLDEVVERIKRDGSTTTRSQVARMILQEHLGNNGDPILARAEEVIHSLYSATQEAFAMLMDQMDDKLRENLRMALERRERGEVVGGRPRRQNGKRDARA